MAGTHKTADPNKNNKDIPKEDKHGNVHQPAGGVTHSTIARLKMLLAHNRHPAPEAVAEIMVERPNEHEHIVRWLHEHFGNSFVHKVMTTGMAKAKRAYSHDVSFAQHGKEATGFESPNADHGKQRSGGDDPNRMTDHGQGITLAHDTDVYRGDGSGYDEAQVLQDRAQAAGQPAPTNLPPAGTIIHAKQNDVLRLETGAVKTMKVKGPDGTVAAHPCVLCFQVGNVPVSGWIPTWAIDPKFHRVLNVDKRIAAHLDAAGDKDKKHFAHKARKVNPVPAPHPELRVSANQRVGSGANMVDHYFERPGGVVNLLANVPASGGGRFGVPLDVLVKDQEFFEDTSVAHEHTPLWESGKNGDQTDMKITFAYGKIETPGGPKYGWINMACLS